LKFSDLLREAWGGKLSLDDREPEFGADEPLKPTSAAVQPSSSSEPAKK
jgi:hypothetical protein